MSAMNERDVRVAEAIAEEVHKSERTMPSYAEQAARIEKLEAALREKVREENGCCQKADCPFCEEAIAVLSTTGRDA